MKKQWILGLLLLAVAAFLISRFVGAGNAGDENVVRIGAILPLTGQLSAYGSYAKAGHEKAIKHLNESQQKYKFEYVYEDTESEGSKATTAYTRLVEKADAIISGSSKMTMPIFDKATSDNILFFPSSSHPKINNPVFPYTYRLFVTAEQESSILLSQLLSVNRLAIITINDDFGKGFNSNLMSKLNANSIIFNEFYDPKESDFSTFVTKLKSTNPTSILMIAYGKSGGNILKKIREQNIKSKIYTSFSFLLTEADKVAGEEPMKGVTSVDIEYLNSSIGKYETIDYSTVMLLGEAFIKQGKNKEKVKLFLDSLKEFNSGVCVLKFDNSHNILPQIKLISF